MGQATNADGVFNNFEQCLSSYFKEKYYGIDTSYMHFYKCSSAQV